MVGGCHPALLELLLLHKPDLLRPGVPDQHPVLGDRLELVQAGQVLQELTLLVEGEVQRRGLLMLMRERQF